MIRLSLPPDVPPPYDGDPPRRTGLSWLDWAEILLIVAAASGASAGLVLGLDRAINGEPTVCIGTRLGG